MLLLDETEPFGDQNHHSAPFSSENEAQGGDPGGWQCTPPPSSSPSQPLPSTDHAHSNTDHTHRHRDHTHSNTDHTHRHRDHTHSNTHHTHRHRDHAHSPSPTHGIKKRSSKPAHMRRNIRKLLREHQLEATTKAAQQEELERRRRLEQQRKQDFPLPLLPGYTTADVPNHIKPLSASTTAASQQEVKVCRQEVICLDSSSTGISEDEVKPEELSSKTGEIPHKTDVIDLSSGDDDSAIPVSSDSPAEEGDLEPSGAHAIDSLNRPDAQGRVLVNVNHPETDHDIYLCPQLARAVKPHQIGGIRFLYDNLVESLQRFGSSPGFGCILAHSMGLGKTLQVISFIDVLFRHTQVHTVLAIVPVNTLQNWLHEFNMWVPASEALSPDVDHKLITPRSFNVHILNDEHKNTASRAKVVEDWYRDGGVLLMGYEMYRLLSLKKGFVSRRKKKNKKNTTNSSTSAVIDLDEEDRQQELLKGIEQALARPGPDVVICDEGHRIKNCHASTSQALKNIHTRRRVVLTGYPLQNNLIEYWCMVDFVRPDFLGTRQEFSNMFERPILNGQCVDSTPQDMQLMRYRSHVLHSLLEGFVQRRGHDVLKEQLPSKEEHVILVRLSPLQRALYTEFMARFREAGNSGWLSLNPIKAFCVCCKIWNHPDVLYEALQKENLASEQDLDLDDITSSRCQTTNQKPKPLEMPIPIGGLSLNQLQEKANQVITYEWAKDILCDYKPGILENSAKMVLLFYLIEESVRKGDKLLVFSQSLSTLTVIEDFLAKRPVPPSPNSTTDKPTQNWVKNLHYYRLDGSTTASERERLINQFNDPSNTSAWVFLLSTRAGCLGVNLIGANRVVVFDASWNPCHDAQAVCRVYRYGQKKQCHIYRLVCDFTLEKKIYDRQISKQGMSDRVVDDLNPVLTFTRREVESLLHFVEEEPDPSEVHLQHSDGLESVLRRGLSLFPHLITKQPFAHESLLMDRREMKLSSAEKKAAKKGYEEEKRASVPYTRPSYAHYYPASDQSLTNIPAFSQRNWRPPPARVEDKPVASVCPVQQTPVPMAPRQASSGPAPNPDPASSSSKLGGFPMNCLQKAGVMVQKIVTTTDIVIPGTNSSTDVQATITAGESIHIIRGTKGTYIRTSDGRIFAIRAANKAKALEENAIAPPKDSQPIPEDLSTNGSNVCVSPDRKLPSIPRPISPDSPEIIDELQRYTGTSNNKPQTNGTALPNMATAASSSPQDLRTTTKRKSSFPTLDEPRGKQLNVGQHSSVTAALASQSYPFNSRYALPHLALNPTMLSRSHYMNLPYFQPSQLGESGYLYPDIYSTSTTATTTVTTTSSSMKANSNSISPFMLNPNVASLSGMLPPGFPLPYTQSLASLYSKRVLNGGLPASAATPGPAGASFLSKFPPSSENQRSSVLINSANVSSSASSSDNDDDVIEVKED